MRKKKLASVQQHFIHAREVQGDILSLAVPGAPNKRTYVSVLAISPINFVLKAEEEQEALLHRYSALLKALTFSIQILVRNGRLDLRPYLARLRAGVLSPVATSAEQEKDTDCWPELAADIERFVSHLGSRRTLLTRQCYLIIPAPESFGTVSRAPFAKKQRRVHKEALRARQLSELAVRVEMMENLLQSLGLPAQRLTGPDLVRLYQCCLAPEQAMNHPLRDNLVQVAGRLPQVKNSRTAKTFMQPAIIDVDQMLPFEEAGNKKEAQRSSHTSSEGANARPRNSRWHRRQRATLHDQASLPPSDVVQLTDLLAPASIEEFRDAVRVGGKEEEWVRGIAVTAFPREVSTAGWLTPLLLHDDVLDVIFHIHPQESIRVLRQFKRQRTGYAATKSFNRRYGRLDEPEMEVAQADVLRLMSKLASGEERMFEVSLLILVRGHDRQTLDERSERIMALLQTVFLDAVAHPTTFEHGLALQSALPECRDHLARTITLDASSLSTTFPFISNSLSMPGGALLGTTENGEPVLFDPWDPSLENPHITIVGPTGSGKSTTCKTLAERIALIVGARGEQAWFIDPDGEYHKLAQAMRGHVVRIESGSIHHLNPFDLVAAGFDLDTYLRAVQGGNRLAEKIQDLLSLLTIMLAEKGTTLSSRERALLDGALYETYRRVGISRDPRTHYHAPPLLRDLAEVLRSGACGRDEYDLVLRLSPYIEGSQSGLFDGQTTVPLDSHWLVWDVREMKGAFRPIGIFLIADAIWTQALYHQESRRALYIDEVATLLEHEEGGVFLADLSRRARKRSLRLVTMTQNPELFVENEHGAVIAANAATKILKRQARTSLKAVVERFGLTRGEAERLLVLAPQESLVLAGDRRVLLTSPISAREYRLMNTDPATLDQHKQGEPTNT